MIKYQLSLGYLRPACYLNGVYRLLSISPERNEVVLTDCTGNVTASLSCELPNIEIGELVNIEAKVWTPRGQQQKARIDTIEHLPWKVPLPKSIIRLPVLHTLSHSELSEKLVALVDQHCDSLQKWQLRELLECPGGAVFSSSGMFNTRQRIGLPAYIITKILSISASQKQ